MKFIAAAVQMLASDDKAANLQEAEHWLRQAAAAGARVVVLPEVFIWRGNKKSEWEFAEPISGPTATKLAELARDLQVYLLAGSILEAIPDSRKAYNTSLLFDPSGQLIAS
jgi:predicted amidohydrolase